MKKAICILGSIICSLMNSFSQDTYDESYTYVIAQPYLNLREKPDKDSKVLIHIPFGERIIIKSTLNISDTINDFIGYWCKTNYKGQTGYAWSQYLANYSFAPDSNYNVDFKIMHEGMQCTEINYMPKLNWYGLYETNDSSQQELKKIDVEFKFRSAMTEDEAFKYFGGDADVEYDLKTNIENKSIILIGSAFPLREGKINGILFGEYDYQNKYPPNFLYPEQIRDLTIKNSKSLGIKAKVEFEIIDTLNLTINSFYGLELIENIEDYYRYDDFITQNLTKDIPYIESPKRHALYQNPRIIWYGDIDDDNKIDLIIHARYMYDACGTGNSTLLFLSSKAENKNFVKKVAQIESYGCY